VRAAAAAAASALRESSSADGVSESIIKAIYQNPSNINQPTAAAQSKRRK